MKPEQSTPPPYLLLAAAELATFIPNVGVVTLRELHDEVVRIRLPNEVKVEKKRKRKRKRRRRPCYFTVVIQSISTIYICCKLPC